MGEARRRSMQSIRNFNYSSSSGRIASPTSYCSYLLTLKLMLTWAADFEVDLQSELLVWPSRKAAGCRSLIESSSNSSFTVPSWEFSRCAAVNCFFSSPPPSPFFFALNRMNIITITNWWLNVFNVISLKFTSLMRQQMPPKKQLASQWWFEYFVF